MLACLFPANAGNRLRLSSPPVPNVSRSQSSPVPHPHPGRLAVRIPSLRVLSKSALLLYYFFLILQPGNLSCCVLHRGKFTLFRYSLVVPPFYAKYLLIESRLAFQLRLATWLISINPPLSLDFSFPFFYYPFAAQTQQGCRTTRVANHCPCPAWVFTFP